MIQSLFERKGIFMSDIVREIRTYMSRVTPRPSLFFDIEVTDHCNLNCKGCGSFAPLAEPWYVDVENLEKDLRILSSLSKGEMHRINILGGEPLLHPNITEIIEITRQYFPIGNINFVTNGILLLDASDLFWKCCSDNGVILRPTKYPINIDWEAIKDKAMDYNVKYQYFGCVTKSEGWIHNVITDNADRNEVHSFLNCANANNCTVLKNGKLYPCPKAAKIDIFNKYFSTEYHVSERDYLELNKVKSLEEIMEFMTKPIPFCKYCNPYAYSATNWETSKKLIEEWT